MDEHVLAKKGIRPSSKVVGYVEGFKLRIGERATLLQQDGRAYGVVMDIANQQAAALYSEASVADYEPEAVTVTLDDGTAADAICYNLPMDKVAGTNKDYAASLLKLAEDLDFPKSYLDEIRQASQ